MGLESWSIRRYQFTYANGKTSQIAVSSARSTTLESGWSLSFPAGWETPESIAIDKLAPWTELENEAARHFSGTATYHCNWNLDALHPNERVMLDLGRVSDIAKVHVNGTKAATLWVTPFRVEITRWLKPGDNRIEIAVTNTWQNRLIYDEARPKAKRKTWAIHAPKANTPLTLSGLSGPVKIHIGTVHELP